eukprot:Pgem_evm1s17229
MFSIMTIFLLLSLINLLLTTSTFSAAAAAAVTIATCQDYIMENSESKCNGEQYIGLYIGTMQSYPNQPVLCHCKNEVDYQQVTTRTICPYGYQSTDMYCNPKPVGGVYPNQTAIPPLCEDEDNSTLGFYVQCFENCKAGFVSFVNLDPFNNKMGLQSCIKM